MTIKCIICNEDFENGYKFSSHLKRVHETTYQAYYNKHIKTKLDGICKVCGQITNWSPVKRKYFDYCSQYCVNHSSELLNTKKENSIKKWGVEFPQQSKQIRKKITNTNIKKYGYKNPLQNKTILAKRDKTNLERYGVKSPLQNKDVLEKAQTTNLIRYGNVCSAHGIDTSKKIKETNLARYGVENANSSDIIKNKKKATLRLRYGVESPFAIDGIKEEIKQTWIHRYGVDNPTKCISVIEKVVKTSKYSKLYTLPSGTTIYKQGYEPQFLDYVFKHKYLREDEIDYHPKGIKYKYHDGTEHYYFPDFYIPKLNLIIEIKSKYTEILDTNISLKEIATKESGFNYIRIVNNSIDKKLNFDEFLRVINHE